ncbi:MAG: preprotein translocase subunit SecG [Bacteroidota bacterium]
MYSLLITLSLVIAVLLIIVVLLQSSKGGGLAGSFGGAGNFGTVFGTRRTADFLSRATWWLGGALLVLAVLINLFFLPGQTTTDQRESIIQRGNQQTVPTSPALPQQQSSQPAQK